MVGPMRPQFVLFGSSIVQFSFGNGGWGAILADLYSRKADILVRGYAGWNSGHGLQVLEQVFQKDASIQPSLVIVYFGGNDSMLPDPPGLGPHDATIQPSLVIVYFGGNDSMRPNPLGLGPHLPLSEYVENMRKIATHLKSLSQKTRLIFLTAPPVNEEQMRKAFSGIMPGNSRTNKLLQMYSDACVELCREMDIKAVDLFTSMQKRNDWLTVCFTDGIHFSSEGSKIVVEEMLKVLEEADWEPSLQWNSLPTEFEEFSPYTAAPV